VQDYADPLIVARGFDFSAWLNRGKAGMKINALAILSAGKFKR
jgi:hypothetical protein